jgi:probable phosphoglycerate mutase
MWNRERRLQGHQDAPLTRIGVEQALRVGRTLRGHVGDPGDCQVLVSPLGRCRQTAALICEELDFDYRHCRFDDAIKEIGWGVWDGLTRDEIEARYPGEWTRRNGRRWDYAPPDGESYAMLSERVAAWLDALPGDGTVIAVAHGGVGRAVRGVYAGLPAHETMTLEQPQDAFFLLAQGEVARIETVD